MPTIEELQQNIQKQQELYKSLESRIKVIENNKDISFKDITRREFLPVYDILKVYKLIASLPVYTSARTDIPMQGEIYITDISGTRKLNAYINGIQYSITIT